MAKVKKSKKKNDKEEVATLSTVEVAELVSEEIGEEVNAKALRVYIRDSGIFGEQRNKRYVFEEDDSKIDELIDYIKERRASKKSEESDDSGKSSKKSKKDKSSKKSKKKSKKKAQVEEDEDEDE